MDVLSTFSTRVTPQSEKARADQVENRAGGWTFNTSDQVRLHRFLTLGTEGGTFYASAAEMTRENAQVVLEFCGTPDGADYLVDQILQVSLAGRAPKQQPAIFALAIACAHAPTEDTRHTALMAIPSVCRTGSTLFTFLSYIENFRGWGKGLQRGVARWYFDKPVDAVAYQMVKYRNRLDWKHRDALRFAHQHLRPKPLITVERAMLFNWLCDRDVLADEVGMECMPPIVVDYMDAQAATDGREVINIVERGHGLSWEMIPDQHLSTPGLWGALIAHGLPVGTLIRQLPRLTRIGAVSDRLGHPITSQVTTRLADTEALKRARVHPMNVLVGLRTYAAGVSARGDSTWTPSRKVIDALDAAFYASYGNVEPSGANMLLALDVSGSMGAAAAGMPITCREAVAAMALVTANVETDWQIVGFTGGPVPAGYRGKTFRGNRFRSAVRGEDCEVSELQISPRMRMDDVLAEIDRLPFGPTDCSQPMLYALQHKIPVDCFVIFTDNETWYGQIHPHQALEQYRRKMGRPQARLVVVSMTGTRNSITDPNDPLQLDISGFDSTVPQAITDFAAGRL